MEKATRYFNVKFNQETIIDALKKVHSFVPEIQQDKINIYLEVKVGNDTWYHENEGEFFSDYNKCSYAHYGRNYYYSAKYRIDIYFWGDYSLVKVVMPLRHQIEEVQQIFQTSSSKSPAPNNILTKPRIFLGHGRNSQWKELKEHLQDKHSLKVEAYEIGARAGHTIRDILEEMLKKSSMAFLVLTAEDKDEAGQLHARENVIHELGLFQGKLGFHKAIAVVEEGTTEFSNINGIQQIRFSKGNIKEVFGEVLATLRREKYY